MGQWDAFIKWFFAPSTFRGFIIGVTGIFGYAMPADKLTLVLGIGGFVLTAWEMIRKQYDTQEQNAEVE